jgi:hypothetical protein
MTNAEVMQALARPVRPRVAPTPVPARGGSVDIFQNMRAPTRAAPTPPAPTQAPALSPAALARDQARNAAQREQALDSIKREDELRIAAARMRFQADSWAQHPEHGALAHLGFGSEANPYAREATALEAQVAELARANAPSRLMLEQVPEASVARLMRERERLQGAKTTEEYLRILQELRSSAVNEALAHPRPMGPQREFGLPEAQSARLAPIPEDMMSAMKLGREMNTIAPYQNAAKQHAERAALFSFPREYRDYMNPYQQAVVDRIREEGVRTLREHMMPQLESTFIGRGHHGSSRHQQLAERATRDMLNEITGQQSKALHKGYSEGAQIQGADRARQLEAARQLGQLGQQAHTSRLADIGTLENQARYLQNWDQLRRNMAYEQYQREENAPWESLERQAAILHGMPYQALTSRRSYEMPAESTYVPSTMGNIGQLAMQLAGLNRMNQ